MRNPNRTTKGERRFVRRYNPYAARVLGAAEAARWYRRGILLDEAAGFDNILNDLKHGPVRLDLNDRVNATIDGKRDRLERILGTVPGALTPTSSNVNHYSGGPMQVIEVAPRYTEATGYDVEPDGYINLRYPAHISMVMDVHQLEPGEWQATVDATRRTPASLTLPESLGGGTIEVEHDVAEADGPGTLHDCTIAPCGWTQPRAGADPRDWHDPDEAAALRAEAIERELDDDINPEE